MESETLPNNVDFDNTEFWGIPSLAKSSVWIHFRCKKDQHCALILSIAYCIICRAAISYGENHNTSNLKKHLRSKHPLALKHRSEEPPEPKRQKTLTQPTIQDTLLRHNDNNEEAQRQRNSKTRKLNLLLVHFICTSLVPFNILENDAFRRMFQLMDPQYPFPSRKQFTTVLLHREYALLRETVAFELQEYTGSYSITLDFWTSRATTSFVTLTLHWIDAAFKLNSRNLTSQAVYERHTGLNIGTLVEDILKAWNISMSRITAVVTDTASNMESAATSMKLPWFGCFAHRLHLCVLEGLKLYDTLLIKCRALITHFKKSTVASNTLEQTYKDLGIEYKKLKQDVPTRWSSTYDMLKRLLDSQLVLMRMKSTLPVHLVFLSTEWDDIGRLANVLFPLHQIIVKTQAQKFITISMVLPLLQNLRYEQLLPTKETEPSMRALMDTIAIGLSSRFKLSMKDSKVELIASALDPRFKNLGFLDDPHLKKQVWEVVEEELKLLETIDEVVEEGRTFTEEEELQMIKNPLHEERDVLFQSNFWAVPDTSASPAKLELERWKLERFVHYTTDPLKWWSTNGARFPLLAIMAAKYLAVPATNAPSERAFSILGHTISNRRSQLSPKNVHKMFFIHENRG